MPDLAAVEAIASETPTRTVTLTGMSVAVLLSCLDAGNRWFDWFTEGYQVNYDRYADVLNYLSQARFELMTSQVGEIRITAAATIPGGCLVCDGATYDKADYPYLYAVLSPAFIIDGSSFKTPDLRGRFAYGADATNPVGNEGGEASHSLTIDELPSHSHSIPLTATTLAVEPGEVAVLTPIPILTSSTGDTGGSAAHNTLPPFVALQYYIVAI